MSPPIQADLAQLLAQSGWVRRIATRLVDDSDTADELAQQTYVAALERPPSTGTPIRAWAAKVVLNFARQHRRRDARRSAREAESARHEAQPSAHDVVAGLALQQELARALSGLVEPYRSTLYQRFYEGLPPREIARRANVPVKTVKTRLARGLAELRSRLDREHGGREAWLSMLVPWIGREHAAVAVLGGLIVQLKFLWMIAALAVCALVALFLTFDSGVAGLEPGVARTRNEALSLSAPEPTPSPLASETSDPLRAKTAIPSTVDLAHRPTVSAAPGRLHGRVIDTRAGAVSGVDVLVQEQAASNADAAAGPDVLARTDDRGEFDVAPREGRIHLGVEDRAWTTVLQAYLWGDESKVRPTIVVAERNPLGGLVLDAARQPIADARLTLEVDESLRRDIGEILDNVVQKRWSTTTDVRGHFDIEDAPRVPGRLVVRSPQFVELSIPIPDHPAPDMVLVLEPREEPHVLVTGMVVDPNGKPVEDAWVVAGNRSTRSDASGAFQFDLTAPGQAQNAAKDENGVWVVLDDRSEIRALKPGYLPAILRLAEGDELARPTKAAAGLRKLSDATELRRQGKLEPIALRLGAPPRSIRGVIEDEDGRPVKSVKLELANETAFGSIPARQGSSTWQMSMEQMLRGGIDAAPVLSDEQGRFEFGGLLDKSYDLFLLEKTSLRHTTVRSVPAGTEGLVVRLGSPKGLKRVAGHVVGKNGEKLGGVLLFAGFKMPDGMPNLGARVTSDANGAFAFGPLAMDGIGIQIATEDLFLVYWREITPDETPDDLTVVVSRRCFLQVDISDRADLADHVVPLNAKGERSQIMEFMDGAIGLPEVVTLTDGKSEVVAVEEDTTTIVFYKGEQEVLRKAVVVAPRERIVVRS